MTAADIMTSFHEAKVLCVLLYVLLLPQTDSRLIMQDVNIRVNLRCVPHSSLPQVVIAPTA